MDTYMCMILVYNTSCVYVRDHWCLPSGILRKNNSRLLEEIVRQQQDLLGAERSKYNVEFLNNGSDKHQHQGKDLAQFSVIRIMTFSDYEQSQDGVQ